MARLLSFLVISTLLLLVHSEELGDEYKATLTNMGLSTIFSEETIHLKCSIPDTRSTWVHEWYRNGQSFEHSGDLIIPSAKLSDAGTYICVGVRKGVRGSIYTPKSLPEEITVNGGHVVLTVRQPVLVGETLEAKCLVRGSPRLMEVFLYKDDVLVSSRRDEIADFQIPNVNLTYQGTYYCIASWFYGQLTSAKSLDNLVTVKEVVTQPILTLDSTYPPKQMTLRCKFTFIKPDPAAEVHVYFYRDDKKLEGIARSEKTAFQYVLRKPGAYRCRTRVPSVNLEKWSQTVDFSETA